MKQRLQLVAIEWEDSYSGNQEWFKAETMPNSVEPLICLTVGFIVVEEPDRLTVAQSFSHDSYANLWTVPIKMIRKITKLQWFTLERPEGYDKG